MDKLPVGQLPDLQQSNNDDEIMVITNSEYNQLKKEKISDLITDFTSTNENNALTKGTDGKMFVTDFGNASNITEGTLPVSVLPNIPKDKLPDIEITDLPASGVTADTYAYPSSVTVNAQGMVTAISEGSPSGANANTDLSNLSDEGEKHFLNKTQITNCITKIPQRINVELNNGALTLKAGSVVIVPYGTSAPAFEVGDPLNGGEIVDISWDGQKLFYFVKYTSDKVNGLDQDTNTSNRFIFVNSNQSLDSMTVEQTFSSPTAPSTGSSQWALWYDTTNNNVKYTNDSGSSWMEYYTLPLAIGLNGPNAWESLDTVFNGFGFIGSTIWCDKGVKGLASMGRNADGTFNNKVVETNYVQIKTIPDELDTGQGIDKRTLVLRIIEDNVSVTSYLSRRDFEGIYPPDTSLAYTAYWFNPETGESFLVDHELQSWIKQGVIKIAQYEASTTSPYSITNFSLINNKPFRAVNYNDTGFIAHQAMPSSAINLSLGVSGSTYIAPADGYMRLSSVASSSLTHMTLSGSSGTYIGITLNNARANTDGYGVTLPVSKGEIIRVSYSNLSSDKIGFRFIYANGSK